MVARYPAGNRTKFDARRTIERSPAVCPKWIQIELGSGRVRSMNRTFLVEAIERSPMFPPRTNTSWTFCIECIGTNVNRTSTNLCRTNSSRIFCIECIRTNSNQPQNNLRTNSEWISLSLVTILDTWVFWCVFQMHPRSIRASPHRRHSNFNISFNLPVTSSLHLLHPILWSTRTIYKLCIPFYSLCTWSTPPSQLLRVLMRVNRHHQPDPPHANSQWIAIIVLVRLQDHHRRTQRERINQHEGWFEASGACISLYPLYLMYCMLGLAIQEPPSYPATRTRHLSLHFPSHTTLLPPSSSVSTIIFLRHRSPLTEVQGTFDPGSTRVDIRHMYKM